MTTPDVATVVVGAGIAGLAAAAEAAEFGSVVVLEASDRVGGHLRSVRVPVDADDPAAGTWLCEHAAASVNLPGAGISTLIATTGANLDLVAAGAGVKRRWVLGDDSRLVELSPDPRALLTAPVVSPWAKLGVLVELGVAPHHGDGEESVTEFLQRRFGAEVASKLAQPFVAGVFGGSASQLSVDAAFPQLRALERQGSVLRAGLRRRRIARKAEAPKSRLWSFTDGMETLPRRIAEWLGPEVVQCGRSVATLARRSDGTWQVGTDTGDVTARHVVLAGPSRVASDLLATVDADLAAALGSIPHAPIAVVHIGTDAADLAGFDGFGFLVHPRSGRRILGAVFDSAVFAHRAPEGKALLRVLIGGALAPDLVELDDDELVRLGVDELGACLGRDIRPVYTDVVRHRHGIPQYVVGHAARMRSVDAALARLDGLDVAGWSYRGIGVATSVADATARTRRLFAPADARRADATVAIAAMPERR